MGGVNGYNFSVIVMRQMFDFSVPLSLEQFDYKLPRDRIAQIPATPRDSARLLVSHPKTVADLRFHDLPSVLRPGDLLVFNDTRVIPARLPGRKATGGQIEVFLLRPTGEPGVWEALVGSNKRIVVGSQIAIGPGFDVIIQDPIATGFRVYLHHPGQTLEAVLERYGQVPLPPYIDPNAERCDRERYQTVFARHAGAVAAPTAGLHVTESLLLNLAQCGIQWAWTTLHVGLGTFQPLRPMALAEKKLHGEWCHLPELTVDAIHTARKAGGRVIAVGTTVVRTLESAFIQTGSLLPWEGQTDLFIQPGFEFRVVEGMITNFHLPRSSLLFLVGAFVGLQRLNRDYDHALAGDYRFYSYGDTSLLWP